MLSWKIIFLLTLKLNVGWPFPKRQILDSSKLKKITDDNFKFDRNGKEVSKQVKNTAGEGENACYEQFLLFPQCFQKICPADT